MVGGKPVGRMEVCAPKGHVVFYDIFFASI